MGTASTPPLSTTVPELSMPIRRVSAGYFEPHYKKKKKIESSGGEEK
jgi:hypothetical protein